MIVRLPIGFSVGEGDAKRVVHEVDLKPLDGFSRQIITDPQYKEQTARLTTTLLTHCILTVDGVKPTEDQIRNLTTADRNSLMIHLQKISVGKEVKARYICGWCNAGAEVIENLDNLVFTEQEAFADYVQVELKTGYKDKDGVVHTSVTLGLPTGIDEEVVGHFMRSNYGEWCNVLIAKKVIRFGSLDMNKFAGMGVKVIQSLMVPDIDQLINAITSDLPGFAVKHEVICKKCGRGSEHILDMSYFF